MSCPRRLLALYCSQQQLNFNVARHKSWRSNSRPFFSTVKSSAFFPPSKLCDVLLSRTLFKSFNSGDDILANSAPFGSHAFAMFPPNCSGAGPTLFVSSAPSGLSTSNFTPRESTLGPPRRPSALTPARTRYCSLRSDATPADEASNQVAGQFGRPSSDMNPGSEEKRPPSRNISIGSNFYRVDPERIQDDAEENLRGFIKTRGSLIPGEEFVFWWVGDIYDMVDDEPSRHVCSFEGYNIGRMIRVDGGWRMLTREVGLYKDKVTGEILDTWENPHTGATNKCVHVWNDPVNQQFLLNGKRGEFRVPTTMQGDDIYWHSEVFLRYKSPLSRAEYPEVTASDTYQSTEMFQFFSKKEDLAADKPSADCLISWVRVGQWLPWMEMGDKPGRLVYHCRGRKLKNGFQDLSETVRNYILEEHPEYCAAPTNYSTPNETSWTYMKKLLDAKGSPRADGTVARPESTGLGRSGEKGESDAEPLRMTREELRAFCGREGGKAIYLSVRGRIFDVSSAGRHYRRGETYNCLTGKDASYAFISGDLSEEGIANTGNLNVDNLTEEQSQDLDKWVTFFSQTYPEVGVLVDY